MAHCHDPLLPLAQGLLTCATELLASCGRPVCRASLVPGGTVAADICCDCDAGVGQLWVLVRSIVPELSGSQMSCAWSYLATLEVGVFRCSQAMEENGDPPSAAVLDDEATTILLDAAVLREAVTCCWPAAMNLENGNWSIGSWSPLGPQGGCAGGALSVEVRFSDCAC